MYPICICIIFVSYLYFYLLQSRNGTICIILCLYPICILFCILFVSTAIKMVLFVSQKFWVKICGGKIHERKKFTWIVSASFTEENLVFPFSCCKSSPMVYNTANASHIFLWTFANMTERLGLVLLCLNLWISHNLTKLFWSISTKNCILCCYFGICLGINFLL